MTRPRHYVMTRPIVSHAATCAHPTRRGFGADRKCRECIQVASTTAGGSRRGGQEAEAIARLPRARACTCAQPAPRSEGPLLTCALCSREVACQVLPQQVASNTAR